MERYDQLCALYEESDTDRLRALQNFVGVFPPVDSRVALEYWQDASDDQKETVRDGFPGVGEAFADVAAHADRDGAFTAMDLLRKYDRGDAATPLRVVYALDRLARIE